MRRVWPVVRIAFVAGLVGTTAYGGISDGLSTLRSAETAGEAAAAGAQLVYGALSIAVLLGMAFRPGWVTALLIPWAVALTATGAVAPVVWGDQRWSAGAVAGVATAAAAALVIAGWRVHRQGEAAPPGLRGD